MATAPRPQGLRIARLMMVISSMTPLFVVWAIRGANEIPDRYFLPACAAMIAAPNLILLLRIRAAKNSRDFHRRTVGTVDDQRQNLLTYLFSWLLPFYRTNLDAWRDLGAVVAALLFVIFLFWHLNLHYMNILFAIFGYRVYTVQPPEGDKTEGTNRLTGKASWVLISRRLHIRPGDQVVALRLSDTVFFEEGT